MYSERRILRAQIDLVEIYITIMKVIFWVKIQYILKSIGHNEKMEAKLELAFTWPYGFETTPPLVFVGVSAALPNTLSASVYWINIASLMNIVNIDLAWHKKNDFGE